MVYVDPDPYFYLVRFRIRIQVPQNDSFPDTAPDPQHWEQASHTSEEYPILFNNQQLSGTLFDLFFHPGASPYFSLDTPSIL
jgi:hypothetical protein